MRKSSLIKPWAYPVKQSQDTQHSSRKETKPTQRVIPPKTLLNQNSSRSVRSDTKNISLLTDKHCIEAQEILESGENYDKIDNETLDILPLYLNQYSQTCARNKDLDSAEKAALLKSKAKTENQKRKILNSARSKDSFQDDFEDDTNKQNTPNFDDTLKKFDEETNKYYQVLKQKHEKENSDFERIWSEEMPSKYRKCSPELLQQKYIYQQLILTKQYTTAKQKSKEIEYMEQQEVIRAQNQMNYDYINMKKQLIHKQNKEEIVFLENRKSLRETYETQMKKEKEKQQKLNQNKNREKTLKKTSRERSQEEETGIQRFNGAYSDLKSTEEKVQIDPLLPNLIAPIQSLREQTVFVTKRDTTKPKPNLQTGELNKNIWGPNVDLSHKMFSLKKENKKSNLPKIKKTKLDMNSLNKFNRIQKGWSLSLIHI